jgi:response regulator of citrate/malate metabolism
MMSGFKKVLVAEDDLSLWPMWEAIVKRCLPSAEVHWAVSAEEAKRLINESFDADMPFDVVISDLFLAGSETGLELLRSEEVRKSKASTVLVSMAEIDNLTMNYKSLLPETIFISKPLNVVKCERMMGPIFSRPVT